MHQDAGIFPHASMLVGDNVYQLLPHYGTHNVPIIYIRKYCGVSGNSMARISFLTTNKSNVESHTSMDEFLWYFHYKHLWQRSEKLALKHHSSLKTSSAIYFHKHMRNPSISSCCTVRKKKYNVQKSFSVSLISVFGKKPSRVLGFDMGSGYLRASIALMELAWFWRLFLQPWLILCNALSGAQESL